MKNRRSPNFNDRPDGVAIDMLLLHYTGMRSAADALGRLTDADAAVSAHYVVDEDGTIIQLVEEADRAWHAGVASWHNKADINACSIGIEIVNPGHEFGYRVFPENQMKSVVKLSREIIGRHAISNNRVLGHSDVAPMRKEDPGELFSWKQLFDAGVGIWFSDNYQISENAGEIYPGMTGPQVLDLQLALDGIGYQTGGTGLYEEHTQAAVVAFQRHWRQHKVDGVADAETISAIHHILDQMNTEG